MQVWINGQTREFSELSSKPTLADLVALLEIKADRVAIEQNGEIVPRAGWTSAPVHDGDRFEIVHFVGGGAC
jgi:sulfur carrier protein